MVRHIGNDKTDELLTSIVEITGESKTEAVNLTLHEHLTRLQRRGSGLRLADELNEIALHCAALPVFDDRSADDIIGYDHRGVPT